MWGEKMDAINGWAVITTLVVGFAAWWLFANRFDPSVLRGKRVIVFGASTGIGEEVAYVYARAGAEVVLVARSRDLLEAVATKALEFGAAKAHVLTADLVGQENCKQVVEEAVRLFGGDFDVIVLNHLRPWYGLIHNYPSKFEEIEKIFAVNTFSFFYLALYSLPHLKARRGSILINSSMTGIIPMPFVVPYGASKHAIQGFFQDLRIDISGEMDVSITIAQIGPIATERGRVTLQQSLSHVHHYLPADCAKAIVAAAALRQREVFFPAGYQVVYILRAFMPAFIDRVVTFFTRDLDSNAPK